MPPIIKYQATIEPNILKVGDKIKIKGIVLDGATEFSINFVNELCKNPSDITYHFKWLLDEKIIVENFKMNGVWIEHLEKEYDELDGSVFDLEFAFQNRIYVYKVYDGGRNCITAYETQFDISEIKALQVWGDVQKIKELTFCYA